jgi:hypothetical protein
MIRMSLKSSFFDRAAVLRATDRATRQVLSQFGAFTRTRAQSSILRHTVRKGFGARSKASGRAGISPPGQPPYNHTGLLARFIWFAYDDGRKSVVIGPQPVQTRSGEKGALPLLEYGGRATRRGKPALYRARPFMRPAFNAELPGLPQMWRDKIRG